MGGCDEPRRVQKNSRQNGGYEFSTNLIEGECIMFQQKNQEDGKTIYIVTIFNRHGKINVVKVTNPSRIELVRKAFEHFRIVTINKKTGRVNVEEFDYDRPRNKDYTLKGVRVA